MRIVRSCFAVQNTPSSDWRLRDTTFQSSDDKALPINKKLLEHEFSMTLVDCHGRRVKIVDRWVELRIRLLRILKMRCWLNLTFQVWIWRKVIFHGIRNHEKRFTLFWNRNTETSSNLEKKKEVGRLTLQIKRTRTRKINSNCVRRWRVASLSTAAFWACDD